MRFHGDPEALARPCCVLSWHQAVANLTCAIEHTLLWDRLRKRLPTKSASATRWPNEARRHEHWLLAWSLLEVGGRRAP